MLYVRNLKSDVTEEQLKEKFEPYGKIERVKKIKDYGFIHFEDRDDAVKAMEELNGTVISSYIAGYSFRADLERVDQREVNMRYICFCPCRR